MILSDGTLRALLDTGGIRLDPPPEDHHIQPASIDVTLGTRLLIPAKPTVYVVDPDELNERRSHFEGHDIADGEVFRLGPNQFALAAIEQRVTLPANICARVEGRSSLGRIGLMVHSTAGFVDPGWDGKITLELANVAPWSIILRPGMRIGQLVFEPLDRKAERPYGHPDLRSRYQGDLEVQQSRYTSD